MAGDVVATRRLRTGDAAIAAGDVAGPIAEAEEVLVRFSQMKCSVGALALSPEPVAANLLGLSSVKSGGGRWVEGTMSCPMATGDTKKTPVRIAVVAGKVALFGF
ncbi:hypothetical protein [Sphingomonas aracearum]|nr:hypothetical protein [Sphingomonas aracearum]